MADKQEAQVDQRIVRIWDDPESRIAFLETVLKGKDWEAVVYQPDFSEDSNKNPKIHPLAELSGKLAERGYKVELGKDENGIDTLSVHHFGGDTKIVSAVKELGFAKGMTHKLTHIQEPLGNVIEKTGKLLKHVVSDKARLIGTAYLVGDLFLAGAGGSGHSKDKLKGIAGIAATAQSLIYMGFAKDGAESVYDELMKTAQKAGENGQSLMEAGALAENSPHNHKGVLGAGKHFMESYPLQIGALTQVAGQAAMFAAGAKTYKSGGDKTAALSDMATAVSSAVGWGLVTRHGKEIDDEDKLPWSNPKRIWQEVESNPNKFASGLLSLATATGILGGVKGGNKPQVAAYATYLIGDGLMFATKGEHYGKAGANNAEMLATAAEKFLDAAPLVMGAHEQAAFVKNLSGYLAERASNQVAKNEKREVKPGEADALAERINENLSSKLSPVNSRTNDVAKQIAKVVELFPQDKAGEISLGLSQAVSEMPGVSIKAQELQSHVSRMLESSVEEKRPVTLKRATKPLQELVALVPGGASSQGADRLFDAISKHMESEAVVGAHTAQLAGARRGAISQQPSQQSTL